MLVWAVGVLLIQRPALSIVAKNWVVEYPIQPSVFMRLGYCVSLTSTGVAQ
jgi:hypothetical protein